MHRKPFIDLLSSYHTLLEDEQLMHQQVIDFVKNNPDCFQREYAPGHITASVWIVNPTFTKVLMTHHAKIGLWLQPGGHCDGDTDVLYVAKKELEEETGLQQYQLKENIFDVDVHLISAYKNDPEHLHYDIRFLTIADDAHEIIISDESHDLKWFSLAEALAQNPRRSISRMIDKTVAIASNYQTK